MLDRWRILLLFTWWTSQKCRTSTRCTSCTTPAPSCSFSGRTPPTQLSICSFGVRTSFCRCLCFRNKHIMIDLGTGNNNKINWTMEDKQEMIDIVETVYRGARKGRGLVVSPKDYSTKYRYWFILLNWDSRLCVLWLKERKTFFWWQKDNIWINVSRCFVLGFFPSKDLQFLFCFFYNCFIRNANASYLNVLINLKQSRLFLIHYHDWGK